MEARLQSTIVGMIRLSSASSTLALVAHGQYADLARGVHLAYALECCDTFWPRLRLATDTPLFKVSKKLKVASIYPQTKVTAEDWMGTALRTLIEDGVESVRILSLAQKLDVSRASFYWYFESRDDLLGRLLSYWQEKNTKGIVRKSRLATDTIGAAILHLFECWIDESVFEPRLDFAIREWARRSPEIKALLRAADAERVAAIAEMFGRHGFADEDATVRARVVYYEQIGYYSLGLEESRTVRLGTLSAYVRAFSGTELRPEERLKFERFTDALEKQDRGAMAEPG